ncbi:DUF2059 domain-containing protein [Brevundimonas subvibrioides]|uniref:DUF2059 domain-containing protein n=1 Tax=Brevundimonas subvibrioides TaxID=74313 RepID=UPI0022B2CDBD|nr:DUF2059 domain-containing protein [Brevundimonas subvibrioides]
MSPTMTRAQDRDLDQITGPNAQERLDLARRLVDTMQVDQMTVMMQEMIAEQTASQGSKGDGVIDPQTYNRAIAGATTRAIDRLFTAMAPIYADIYSVEELRGIVAFYESDIGQAALNGMYEAAPRMAALAADLMPAMAREIAADMCAELKCSPDELREAKTAAEGALLED